MIGKPYYIDALAGSSIALSSTAKYDVALTAKADTRYNCALHVDATVDVFSESQKMVVAGGDFTPTRYNAACMLRFINFGYGWQIFAFVNTSLHFSTLPFPRRDKTARC